MLGDVDPLMLKQIYDRMEQMKKVLSVMFSANRITKMKPMEYY